MSKIDYTIGDEIVCINANEDLVENKVYKALSLTTTPCCGNPVVDIGLNIYTTHSLCICNNTYENSGTCFKSATRFKKLDTLVDISELTNVLEKPIFEL